jgi:hypothetical protein
MMTAPHRNGSAKGMQTLWLRSSVQEFFSSVNWENRPLQVVEPEDLFSSHHESTASQAQSERQSSGLDMTLSVSQFFDVFPWDGKPAIAEPIALSNLSLEDEEPEEEITLDDFFGGL